MTEITLSLIVMFALIVVVTLQIRQDLVRRCQSNLQEAQRLEKLVRQQGVEIDGLRETLRQLGKDLGVGVKLIPERTTRERDEALDSLTGWDRLDDES